VPVLDYCAQRLAYDPHLWGTVLFEEIVELGYRGPIRPSPGRFAATVSARHVSHATVIAHLPGEEIQFDWLELCAILVANSKCVARSAS
jgi:hypothetical protein